MPLSSATVGAWGRTRTRTTSAKASVRAKTKGWREKSSRVAVRNADRQAAAVGGDGGLLSTCNRRSNGPASTARTAKVVLVERAWSERRHMSAGEPLARTSRSVVRLLGCVTSEPCPIHSTVDSTIIYLLPSIAPASTATAPALLHRRRRRRCL